MPQRRGTRETQQQSEPGRARKHAVLVIEADADALQRLSKRLERAGTCSEIKHCQTLAHATRVLRTRHFDAVLLGLGAAAMMNLSGSAALSRLRESAPDAALFVLDDSDRDIAPEVARAAQQGAADVLRVGSHHVRGLASALRRSIEQKQREQRRAYMEQHDPLTQLLNREAWNGKLEATLGAARGEGACCAVLLLELAAFSEVKAAHGPEACDTVVCEISRRIQASVREQDTVARIGDSEFGVILTQVDDAQVCSRVAARILEITGMPVLLCDELEVAMRPSIGVAMCSHAGPTSHVLLRTAAHALQTAKAQVSGFVLRTVDDSEPSSGKTAQHAV